MREREVETFVRNHPDLAGQVAAWRAGHQAGTLRDAVADLQLWRNPDDEAVQWLIWCALRDQGDPVALAGFPQMRATAQTSARSGRRSRRTDREIVTAYLRALAEALDGRATATLNTRAGTPPELDVVSHGDPSRSGTVVCRRGGNGWRYEWTWGSVISLPDDLGLAVRTIAATLEPVQTPAGRALAAGGVDASCR
jgi:hypothetical protein